MGATNPTTDPGVSHTNTVPAHVDPTSAPSTRGGPVCPDMWQLSGAHHVEGPMISSSDIAPFNITILVADQAAAATASWTLGDENGTIIGTGEGAGFSARITKPGTYVLTGIHPSCDRDVTYPFGASLDAARDVVCPSIVSEMLDQGACPSMSVYVPKQIDQLFLGVYPPADQLMSDGAAYTTDPDGTEQEIPAGDLILVSYPKSGMWTVQWRPGLQVNADVHYMAIAELDHLIGMAG